jgi:hypothetical protein
MRKLPVGYFIDPVTSELVAILARNKESSEVARKRVADTHNIDVTIITDKPPDGPLNPGLVIDLPERTARPEGERTSRFGRDREEPSPADGVARYQTRLAESRKRSVQATAPIEANIEKGSLLDPAGPAHARSIPKA